MISWCYVTTSLRILVIAFGHWCNACWSGWIKWTEMYWKFPNGSTVCYLTRPQVAYVVDPIFGESPMSQRCLRLASLRNASRDFVFGSPIRRNATYQVQKVADSFWTLTTEKEFSVLALQGYFTSRENKVYVIHGNVLDGIWHLGWLLGRIVIKTNLEQSKKGIKCNL